MPKIGHYFSTDADFSVAFFEKSPISHIPLFNEMRAFDEQERLILRQLIRDPRESDNGIGEATGVSVRTVGRKRQRLEEEGVISYHTHVDLSASGAGQFTARHLYIIKFRIGVTVRQIQEDLKREPFVRSVFTELIFESHIAEIDGRIALLLFIDGTSDVDIVQSVQEKLIPNLQQNHGADSIEEISTVRLLAPIRVLRNYLPTLNMENGYLRKDWPDEAIYVGRTDAEKTDNGQPTS
jgi:DNA-binding Lrp family transcriptional regulator